MRAVTKLVWAGLICMAAGAAMAGGKRHAAAEGKTYRLELAGGIAVRMSEAPFDAKRHRVRGCEGNMPCLIDRQAGVGNMNILPATELRDLRVSVGSRTYVLDTAGMFNPLLNAGRPVPPPSFDGFCYDEKNCQFRARFGDAGGVYSAEWVIEEGVTSRTVLSPSADLFHFFEANPKPPRYE